ADDRVTLDGEVTDALGLPVARIDIRHGDNERAMTQHMTTTLRAIMEAAGAVQVDTRPVGSILGTHLMGTCRMGTDPRTSVTDAGGRCHDLDNLYIADGSLFPTSTPANPTLTIQALATRVAHGSAAGDARPVRSEYESAPDTRTGHAGARGGSHPARHQCGAVVGGKRTGHADGGCGCSRRQPSRCSPVRRRWPSPSRKARWSSPIAAPPATCPSTPSNPR